MKKPLASYMNRSPEVRLSLGDRVLRALIDAAIYIARPRLVLTFHKRLGYWPRPALPQRCNEKYMWRKLFDRDPRHVELADKLAAKAYVQRHWPQVRVPALYWAGDDPDEIPDAVLAGDCVVKANHGSGMNQIVQRGDIDRAELRKKARRWLRSSFADKHDERHYRRIKPRLFAEQLLLQDGVPAKPTYRFHTSGGTCHYVYVRLDDEDGKKREAALDRDGNPRVVLIDSWEMGVAMERPAGWHDMLAIAEKMAAAFDLVRIDLHLVDGEIWFSEYTFTASAGYAWIDDPELMRALNRAWDIRRSWFLSTPQKGLAGFYARRLRAWFDKAAAAGDAG